MPNPETEPEKTYIGDGVYVHFDGFQIWLTTPNQGFYNKIALDDPTFASLIKWREDLIARINARLTFVLKVREELENSFNDGEHSEMLSEPVAVLADSMIDYADLPDGTCAADLVPIITEWQKAKLQS